MTAQSGRGFRLAADCRRAAAAAALLLLCQSGARAEDAGVTPTKVPAPVAAPALVADPLAGRFGGAFALTAPDGRRVTDADLRGHFVLLYFGYTHCPDLCPTDLAVMAQALDALGPRAEAIQPVFVTVDPERDTPAVLKDYAASFHPRLLALGGSEVDVAAAAKAYKVHRRKVLQTPGQTEDYLVDHSSLTYLMGPDGRFLTLFPTNTTAERMATALRNYVP